jgi:hypothetical protein
MIIIDRYQSLYRYVKCIGRNKSMAWLGARKDSDVVSEDQIGWSFLINENLKRKFSVVFSSKYDLSGFTALQKCAGIVRSKHL